MWLSNSPTMSQDSTCVKTVCGSYTHWIIHRCPFIDWGHPGNPAAQDFQSTPQTSCKLPQTSLWVYPSNHQ